MLVQSTRIGTIEVDEREVIHFPEGVVGLPTWQEAVLVPVPDVPLLSWLQFVHDPDAAFLLLDVKTLFPDYDCSLAQRQAGADESSTVLTIVRVPQGDFTQATTNLMAPVIVQFPAHSPTLSRPTATQVILHDADYPLRQRLFAGEAAC